MLKCVSCTTHETPQIINLSEQENNAEKVLSQLPKSRREIFIDAIINGQSYADIAESKGISINTVKTQIKRAYALLRKESTKQLLRVLLLLITSVMFLFKDDF